LSKDLDKVILVYVPRDVQLERATKRDGLAPEEIEKRLHAQVPIAEKRSLSDFVIDNSGSLKHTRDQVRKVMRELRKLLKKVEADTPCF